MNPPRSMNAGSPDLVPAVYRARGAYARLKSGSAQPRMELFTMRHWHAVRHIPAIVAIAFQMLACLLALGPHALASSKYQEFSDFTTPLPLKKGDVLVLGIVGGWERWDRERIVRWVALEVRDKHYPGVYAETVENHRMELARELLQKAFDTNRDGTLDAEEKAGARLILYGQSLGGSAAVRYARELGEEGIPILLLVCIDSYGAGASLVPPNVHAALNIYQRDHLFIKGEDNFTAEDPARTRILGNRRFYYRGKDVDDLGVQDYANEPWIRRAFIGSHLKIEYDQHVRDMVRKAVLDAIPEDRKEPSPALSNVSR